MNEIEELKKKLAESERRVAILIKQCDEWAKSYDNLLKDFIAYRKKTG